MRVIFHRSRPNFLKKLRGVAEVASEEQRSKLGGSSAGAASELIIELKMRELLLMGVDNLTQAFAQGAIDDGTFIGESKDAYAHLLGAIKAKQAIQMLNEAQKPSKRSRRKLLKNG